MISLPLPAMRRTGEWLKKLGAEIVFAIEDDSEGQALFTATPET